MKYFEELEGIDDSSYAFLKQIRMQTWGLIIGPLHEWYHDAGTYYQIEVECYFLDGCGEIKRATISLSAGADEPALLETFRIEYQPGSLHLIDSDAFSILENDITFYHPATTPVTEIDGAHVLKWFDAYGKKGNPSVDNEENTVISGTICEYREAQTKSGKDMAFISLFEYPETSIIIFADLYAEHRSMLHVGSNLVFTGKLDTYIEPENGTTRSNLIAKEISAAIKITTSETE